MEGGVSRKEMPTTIVGAESCSWFLLGITSKPLTLSVLQQISVRVTGVGGWKSKSSPTPATLRLVSGNKNSFTYVEMLGSECVTVLPYVGKWGGEKEEVLLFIRLQRWSESLHVRATHVSLQLSVWPYISLVTKPFSFSFGTCLHASKL
jgi:hypothetical protein